jgi:hypothetical protein
MLMFEDIIDRKLSGWVPPQVADHLEGIRNEMSALKEAVVASMAVNSLHQAECKAQVVALRLLVGSQSGSLPVSSRDSSTTTLSAAAEGRPQPQPDADYDADWWNQGEPINPQDDDPRWSPPQWPPQEPALEQLSGFANQGWPLQQAWLHPSGSSPSSTQALAGRASGCESTPMFSSPSSTPALAGRASGWESSPTLSEQQLLHIGGEGGTNPLLPTRHSPSTTVERTSDHDGDNGHFSPHHPLLTSTSSTFERRSPAMHRRHNPKSCMVCRGSFKKRSSCKEHMLKCLDANARCQFLENCDTHLKYIRPFSGSTTEIRWASAVSEWIRRKA